MHRGERAADSESRRIYGFVESIEPPIPNNNYSRFALMLDAVDAASFDASPSALPQKNNLLIVRVISTPQRIFDLFNIELPQEGKWLELTLGRREGLPPAWVLNANDDYGGQVERTNVIAAQALPAAGEEPDNPHNLVARLEDSCTVKRKKTKTIKNVRAASSRVHNRAMLSQIEDVDSLIEDIDSESTLTDHIKAMRRFAPRLGVPDSVLEQAVAKVEERISEINESVETADSPDFFGSSFSETEKFDDVALKDLFTPLLEGLK